MKLVIYSLTLLAGTVNAGKTAKVISKARNAANIPAVAAVSFNTKKITAFEIAGTTRIDGTIAVKKNSVWHIGSDAKAMTATLMATLIEKKLLKWETTMSELFPKLADEFHPNARKTTITQLLSQSHPKFAGKSAHSNAKPSSTTNIRLKEITYPKVINFAKS